MTDTIPAMIQDLRRERDEAVDRAIYAEAELARLRRENEEMQRALEKFCQEVCFWRPYDARESCAPDCPLILWKGSDGRTHHT